MYLNGNCFVQNLPEGLDVIYDEASQYSIYQQLQFLNKKTGEHLLPLNPPCFFDDLAGIIPLRFSREGAVRMMRLKQGDALKEAEKAHHYEKYAYGGLGHDNRFEYGVIKWNGKTFETVLPFDEYDLIQPINPNGYALIMRIDLISLKNFPNSVEYGVANFDNGMNITIPLGKYPHMLYVTDENMICFSPETNLGGSTSRYGVLDVGGEILLNPIYPQSTAILYARGKSSRSLDQAGIDRFVAEHNIYSRHVVSTHVVSEPADSAPAAAESESSAPADAEPAVSQSVQSIIDGGDPFRSLDQASIDKLIAELSKR